ncbi:hypothetical protein BGZ81_011012 [Podila clonocystis]|nr:hypothetical protein BGZ81_011012 [Podila clonocystis]
MLAKVVCLTASGIAYTYTCLPPPASKTTNKKTDKITDEYWMKKLDMAYLVPAVSAAVHLLQIGVYVYLMITSKTTALPAVQQLAVFELWHIVATAMSIAGYVLRKWSFVTLDQFFTYQLTIRSGHKLVQSGPYTLLLHPSYTGLGLNVLGSFSLIYNRGLWPVLLTYVSKCTYLLAQARIPVISPLAALSPLAVSNYSHESLSFFGIGAGLWIAIVWAMFMKKMLMKRVETEEKMLRQHFGRDWDVYASKRWRFIPFVY